MSKTKFDMNTISVNDVINTLRECNRDWKYEHAMEHFMTFASELTGISEDTLASIIYDDEDE